MLVSMLALLGAPGCGSRGASRGQNEPPPVVDTAMTLRPIEDVLRDHTPALMRIPGVVGTAQGEEGGQPCIIVFVARRSEALGKSIPRELEGHPVRIDEVGEIRPLL